MKKLATKQPFYGQLFDFIFIFEKCGYIQGLGV
jgi:hypothetical protein